MATIVFPTRQVADEILREIAATPAIEGGIGPVWVWFNPDADMNDISYATDASGRCAIAHPWTEVDIAWLTAYITGDSAPLTWQETRFMDVLPPNWQESANH